MKRRDRIKMEKPLPDRRRFLSVCTAGLLAILTGLILTPVAAFVSSPLRRRRDASPAGDDFADAGPVSAIPTDNWTLLPIEIVRQDGWDKTRQSRSVWVLVSSAAGDGVKVLSPICPHLGCPIARPAGLSEFKCPCHGGTFSNDGTLISGPPPRSMDSLESQIRDGHLWVRWQDFRTGVPGRVSVQV